MDQQEQKSKEQLINDLALLRQQLSDLEEQVVNFDLDSDTLKDQESGKLASNQIYLELHDVLKTASEAALVVDGSGRIIS
jgi:hypothetical protein